MGLDYLRGLLPRRKVSHWQRRQERRFVPVPDVEPGLGPGDPTRPTQPGASRPGPSQDQALATHFPLPHPTQHRLSGIRFRARQEEEEDGRLGPSELGPGWLGGGEEMQALWDREDAAVEDGAHGPQDALQRVWGPLQVRQAVPGVPAGGEPDVRRGDPLELAQEGDGDEVKIRLGGYLKFFFFY